MESRHQFRISQGDRGFGHQVPLERAEAGGQRAGVVADGGQVDRAAEGGAKAGPKAGGRRALPGPRHLERGCL